MTARRDRDTRPRPARALPAFDTPALELLPRPLDPVPPMSRRRCPRRALRATRGRLALIRPDDAPARDLPGCKGPRAYLAPGPRA